MVSVINNLPVSLPMLIIAKFAAVAAAGPPLEPPEFTASVQKSTQSLTGVLVSDSYVASFQDNNEVLVYVRS